jgi:AsmA protein
MDFDLRISAARVIAAQGRLGRTAVAATLRDGRLLVTVGESQGFNGLMSGSLAIAKTGQGAHLRSQLQLTDVDLETCLADLFGVRRLEGKGSLSLGIDAEGRSVLALARNVNGSAELVTSRGVLAGFNVEQLLRRLERRPLAGSADFRTGRTPFESLRVTFRIKQGTASVEQGRIEGTNVRLALGGSASIPARDFDLRGTASLLHVGEAPPAFELPFFVQGSWDDPIVLPDTQALIRRSGAAAPLLDAVIDQRAREAVHSAIDRMIEESAHAPRTGGPPPIPFEPPAQANIPAEQPSR